MKNNKYKYEWDLSLLYKDENDPQIEKDIEKAKKYADRFITKWGKNKSYMSDEGSLLEALTEFEIINTPKNSFLKPLYYLQLRNALAQEDSVIKKRLKFFTNIVNEYSNKINFFSINLGKVNRKNRQLFLNSKKLINFRHLLKHRFETSKFDLSLKEENLLTLLKSSAYENWINMIDETLSKEGKIINNKFKTFEEFLIDTRSTSLQKRELANKEINKILNKWIGISEYEINSVIDGLNQVKKIRKLPTYDYDRIIEDDFDLKTLNTLRKVTTESFKLSHRFYDFFTKLTKNKTLGYHEKVMDIGDISIKIDEVELYDTIYNVFNKLSPKLGSIVLDAFTSGNIDLYPKKGKSGGGFCTISGRDLPINVLLNFTGEINDIRTLGHEMGHYVNHFLSNKSINSLETGCSMATAEVASTFFEGFSLDEISLRLNDEEKLILVINNLQLGISGIFRQIACYNFELELHQQIDEKGYLSKEQIGELFSKHMKSYLGPKVRMDKGHENWWVYWGHIRRPFYVYSYASGQLISKSLQNMVRENPKDITKVINFLSKGGSQSPKDIFMELGIDISKEDFWKKGLKEFENNLIEAEELAVKLGKI